MWLVQWMYGELFESNTQHFPPMAYGDEVSLLVLFKYLIVSRLLNHFANVTWAA